MTNHEARMLMGATTFRIDSFSGFLYWLSESLRLDRITLDGVDFLGTREGIDDARRAAIESIGIPTLHFITEITFFPVTFWGPQTQTNYTNKNSAIRKAIEDADRILRGDNKCSEFFGSHGLAALGALDRLLERGIIDSPRNVRTGIQMSSPKGSSPITASEPRIVDGNTIYDPVYRIFHKGVVNSNGPFFNMLSPARIGDYNPNSRESRVLQILHELAHMILVKDEKTGKFDPLIPNDAGSGQGDSETNTNTILEKCKTEIDSLKNEEVKK